MQNFATCTIEKAIFGDSSTRTVPLKPVRAYISVATGAPMFPYNPVRGCIPYEYGKALVTCCI